ncbi:helix-hairpin-helix domain-containing protein [Portibacter lacus]|uniref:Competence protein ComEA n=1 Tax=Portibacter lacus TaxID=1099794 RepID=A0AA37SWW6_9BACT|nr:helix-hairpin-helix domain-containing protein [Portibacter lacus]GLR19413.1 competence protein ComEA [Portibacter lacus]
MKNQLTKLVHIRKRERKSLILILFILLFSSFCDELYLSLLATSQNDDRELIIEKVEVIKLPADTSKMVIVDESTENPEEFVVEQKSFQESVPMVEKTIKLPPSEKVKINPHSTVRKEISSEPFDPNDVNLDLLVQNGIPKRVAHTWINFANAGGKFYKQDDLRKIYGMTEEHIEKIAPNLKFENKSNFQKPKLTTIYINQATAYDFAKISGIGPVLSERIVKFRDRIGGFHSYEQLKEVYGVEETVINENKDFFVIEKGAKKININTCNEQQLGGHSYCSYRTAKTIINYRKQHGNFTKVEDLLEIRVLDKEWIDKIGPYLEF